MPNLGNSMRYGEFHFFRYFRTKNKIKEITLEQDFEHLEWSDVKKISAIDSERIFAQDIGLQIFFEAPRSSKLRPSEGNSLFAAIGFRALKFHRPQGSRVEKKNLFFHLTFFKTTRWNPFISSAFESY